MTSEREFLAAVAAQLGRAPLDAPPAFTPSRPLPAIGPEDPEALADRFQQELERISGAVHRVTDPSQVVPTVLRILEEVLGEGRGAGPEAAGQPNRLVARWADPLLDGFGLDEALAQAGWRVVTFAEGGDGRAFVEQVERAAAGIVAADAGIAETGTIVLLSGLTRGRTVSLLPPLLIALLRKEQIVFDSARIFRRLTQGPMPSQVIFKSGPSRSSDIENDLTIGVHGPGHLHVILL